MNIALYGGKFDPPHLGHQNLIDQVLMRLKFIDQVWVIPAKTHQWRTLQSKPSDRLAMVKFWEGERVKILDLELKRRKKTMTIDTIRELKRLYPKNNYFWICGSDTCETFHLWDEYKELTKLMKFYVYPRPGYPVKILPEGFDWIPGMKLPKRDYSSTEIRNAIKEGKNLDKWLSKEVQNYIKQNKLYC